MVFQYSQRCRWLLWFSGTLFLSSLASTEAASSFRHALEVAYEDHLNRHLSVNNPPVLDFKSIGEERGPPPSADALALYDELVGTSTNYKRWMNKLGFPIEEEKTDLDPKAFDTVIPVLLQRHTESQLLHVFHDPKGDFWGVTVDGKSLGLQLLQHWKKIGVSNHDIKYRMLEADSNHPNMLTDDSMLLTWISFSDGENLGLESYLYLLDGLDGLYDLKDVLRFYFVVSEKSGNPDLKEAASQNTFEVFEDFYKAKLDRKQVINKLEIADDEMEKMESVLDRYGKFASSRSADKLVLEKIASGTELTTAEVDLLEKDLAMKWLEESWTPKYDFWSTTKKEEEVIDRLGHIMLKYLDRSP